MCQRPEPGPTPPGRPGVPPAPPPLQWSSCLVAWLLSVTRVLCGGQPTRVGRTHRWQFCAVRELQSTVTTAPNKRRWQRRQQLCWSALFLCVCWLPRTFAATGLAQLGVDLAGSSSALSSWTGTNPCTGTSGASVWSGVTCAAGLPVQLSLSGLGLTGSVSCAASSNTSLTSIDLVRASAPYV